jgi:hypothetical protein
MKKLFILMVVLIGLSSSAKAQKYFVYDGATFSVMFKCNTANTKVLDVQFSSKDKTTGEWKWNTFKVTDYHDFEDTQLGGFIFDVVDGVGKKFAVDFYRDLNYVIVHQIKADGSYGSQWELNLREE